MNGAWGWRLLDPAEADELHRRLVKDVEGKTLFALDDKSTIKKIDVQHMTREAQERLKSTQLEEVEELYEIRLGWGKRRVWGLMERGVFCLLWWDPLETACGHPPKRTPPIRKRIPPANVGERGGRALAAQSIPAGRMPSRYAGVWHATVPPPPHGPLQRICGPPGFLWVGDRARPVTDVARHLPGAVAVRTHVPTLRPLGNYQSTARPRTTPAIHGVGRRCCNVNGVDPVGRLVLVDRTPASR